MKRIILLIAISWCVSACSPSKIDIDGYQPLPRNITIDAFSMTDQNGALVGPQSFMGRWSLVFFGYTFCPDVCPTTLGDMNQVAAKINDDKLQVVMVSVDPERDTTKQLKDYITYFNPKFQAWRAEVAEIESLAKQLHIFFERQDTETGYNMDHSGQVVLVNDQGQYVGFFQPPVESKKIIAGLKQLMN